MAFIPAANTARVTINQRLHSQKVSNVLYVMGNAPWGSDDLVSLANAVKAWWTNTLSDQLSEDISLESVMARSMQAEDAPGVESAVTAPTPGALDQPALPGNVALAVKFLTGLTGRNRRGRNFIAGLGEASVNGNEVTLPIRDAIVAAYGTLRDTLVGLGWQHVVASFFDGTHREEYGENLAKMVPTPRATALMTPVLSYRADVETDSQRRRLAGRGS